MNSIDFGKFYELIHKMNLTTQENERVQWNRFKLNLWNISDQIRDISRFPSASQVGSGNLSKLCEELHDLICKIPTIEE